MIWCTGASAKNAAVDPWRANSIANRVRRPNNVDSDGGAEDAVVARRLIQRVLSEATATTSELSSAGEAVPASDSPGASASLMMPKPMT